MNIREKVKLSKTTHAVRASQAVLQYGVGAMIDFPEQTVMTAAPETWATSVREIHDERLEKVLAVEYFGMPGSVDEAKYQAGISYVRFPEWYFCPKCRRLKPLKEWVEEYKASPKMSKSVESDPYMINHVKCPVDHQPLVVARIITACSEGHIDDFPWVKWVHAKNSTGPKRICDHPKLKFITSPTSTEGLEGLTVSCETCKCRTTLKGAFDKGALENLDKKTEYAYNFKCSGRHPWNNSKESCDEYPNVLQRGSSSVYFPVSVSSLVIPPYSSMLTSKVQESDGFAELRKAIVAGLETLKMLESMGAVTQDMKDKIIISNIEEYAKKISLEIGKPVEQVKPILERRWKDDNNQEYSTNSIKYRAEEYAALNGEVTVIDSDGEFLREETNAADYDIPYVKKISLIHKIREVQALVGYSRLKPVDSELIYEKQQSTVVDIKDKDTKWYPGYEVRGEGIFIEFDEEAINNWRSGNGEIAQRVKLINDNYKKSFYGSMRDRDITAKFLLLHTISHLLMKQLSFECGYSIASLKERIYCSEPKDGKSMSAILIYTASGDSEGTLGGLVRQGRADTLPAIFKKAIKTARTCSNDPVCSLSQGQGRESLNLSACYSCTLVPETSCEELNSFLDRGMVIGTIDNPGIGFYSDYEIGYIPTFETPSVDSTAIVTISDIGMRMESSYDTVWAQIMQFSNDKTEKKFLQDLIDNSGAFEGKEKPYAGATVKISSFGEIDVDLLWPKSKLLLFSAENIEEYNIANHSDWRCIFTADENVSWNKLLGLIKE